jgi:hypothetical protein
MNKDYEHVYAVIRSDDFLGDDCPSEEKVTVKMIVRDRDEAEREVARLNALQKPGGPHYFWQVTRLLQAPVVAEGAP